MRLPIRVFILTILLSLICTCSSPTDDNEASINEAGELILFQLLEYLPAIPLPVRTAENASNPGFIYTTERVSKYLNEFMYCLPYWIELFRDEGIAPEKIGPSFQWQMTWPDSADQSVVLTVTPGDSLLFSIDVEGFDWTPDQYHEGFVIPNHVFGRLFANDGVREWKWSNLPSHIRGGGQYYYTHEPLEFQGGMSAAIAVITSGGGYIIENQGQSTQLSADWYGLGHGNWSSQTHGSGEW